MMQAARAFVRRFREPIFPDTVEAMRRNRERVPEKLRVPEQELPVLYPLRVQPVETHTA